MATEIDALLQEIVGMKSYVEDKVTNGVEPLKEEQHRMAGILENVETAMKELRRERLSHSSPGGQFRVPTGRVAGFDSLDLKILSTIMEGREARGIQMSGGMRDMLAGSKKDLSDSVTVDKLMAWEEDAIKRRDIMHPGVAGAQNFRSAAAGWRAGMMEAHGKALDSTTSGSGDELVPTIEAATLWMDVNLDTVILPVLQQVPMPSNPFDIPTQFGDTNWYPISENVQSLTTDPSTSKITLTAQGLKTGVPFSDELNEDAIIALVPELRRNLVRNAAEVIDDVLLNADQTATNNINADGATISTSTAGKAQWLLGWDGIIHLPLVDNTSQSNNHNAGVSADMFNEIMAKLDKYAAPRRRGDVVFISDVRTAIRSLSIAEFETVDVAGARATLSTGEILNVYGKPYLHSEQMRIADADGKITSAGNAADTGRLLTLNTSQWRTGFRRQITMETDREPGKGQTTMYVSFRIALQERSGTRSSATHTALQYNITGV